LAQGKESSAAINDPLFSVTRLFFPSQFALCALKTAATNILACAKLHNPGALVGNFWRAKPGKFSRVPKYICTTIPKKRLISGMYEPFSRGADRFGNRSSPPHDSATKLVKENGGG